MAPTDPCWLFGYGSLIFRPAIPFVECRPARARGWIRRFWQWSTDHRGEPWREIELELAVPAEEVSDASPASPRVVTGLTYQAWPGNRNYAGPAPLTEIAAQVEEATGPSGANADYVRDLHAALQALGAEDRHVAALAARLRA